VFVALIALVGLLQINNSDPQIAILLCLLFGIVIPLIALLSAQFVVASSYAAMPRSVALFITIYVLAMIFNSDMFLNLIQLGFAPEKISLTTLIVPVISMVSKALSVASVIAGVLLIIVAIIELSAEAINKLSRFNQPLMLSSIRSLVCIFLLSSGINLVADLIERELQGTLM